jgi:hypothetical protein
MSAFWVKFRDRRTYRSLTSSLEDEDVLSCGAFPFAAGISKAALLGLSADVSIMWTAIFAFLCANAMRWNTMPRTISLGLILLDTPVDCAADLLAWLPQLKWRLVRGKRRPLV